MKKWLLLALLPLTAWANEPMPDHDIAKQMLAKTYQQEWKGKELGDVYYLDSQVAIDENRFYIRSDGFGKSVSIVSCAPNARYIMTILTAAGDEIDEYSNPAVGFAGQDFQDFVNSFKDNADLPYLCRKE